jgi:Fe2+ transport system protein B
MYHRYQALCEKEVVMGVGSLLGSSSREGEGEVQLPSGRQRLDGQIIGETTMSETFICLFVTFICLFVACISVFVCFSSLFLSLWCVSAATRTCLLSVAVACVSARRGSRTWCVTDNWG